MFEFPPHVASRGDAPDTLEPCDPMPLEISSFSEKSRTVSVVLFYSSGFVGSKMENTAFSSVSVTVC